MNPFPCGCPLAVITKYQKRISAPLLDRIDIYIEVPRVDYEKLSSDRMGETSAKIRIRLQAARDIQNKRLSW
jgi:magnesium chelatase family protein